MFHHEKLCHTVYFEVSDFKLQVMSSAMSSARSSVTFVTPATLPYKDNKSLSVHSWRLTYV